MKITVTQTQVEETELVILCSDPKAPEIQRLLSVIEGVGERIVATEPQGSLLLEPQEVLYGEFVNRHVFLYTASTVAATAMTLAQLEERYHSFVRCSKSMVVNLHHITRLRSEISGRILATLSNGECLLISRHYASTIRKVLS